MSFQDSPQRLGALLQQNVIQLTPETENTIPSKKIFKYPYLDKELINTTIQNGKRYAQQYNQLQEEKSAGINKINAELRQAMLESPHTTEQKVLFLEFKQEHKLANAEPMAYNQKIIEFNKEHGTHFLMRKYPTLRNEIAITFSYLVFFYAAQIRDNNARKLNAGVTTAGTLPRLLTNSESLKRYKVEGVPQCPYKNDAILKHVHNLVEAGILINYKSHGRNIGFSVDFNPEILAVGDYKSSKIQLAQNQHFTIFKTCKHPYSDSITRTCKNESEIKGDAKASPGERNGVKTPITGNTYKNTKSEENPMGNPSANREISSQKSEITAKKPEQSKPAAAEIPSLEEKIRETWPLCQELAENMHIHHVPIPSKILAAEAKNGTMSQAAFRELLFQEFMKIISRLKRTNQSAAGAFYRAFEELEDMKLKTFTGRLFTKQNMLEEFEKWIWMVDHAERWGKKKGWRFLFINDYLDTQRRDGKEVGFWYLEKEWNKNEARKAKRKAKRLEKVKAAQIRKKNIKAERVEKYGYRSVKPNPKGLNDFEKARIAVRKYLYGKIPFEELHRYCRHNLNQNIVEGLANLIDAEGENLRKYKA